MGRKGSSKSQDPTMGKRVSISLSPSSGNPEGAITVVKEIEDNARPLDDRFRVQCVKLKCITSGKNRDYRLGVEKTLEILKMYGEKIPQKLLQGQMCRENHKLRSGLPGGRLENVLELPAMVDKRSLKVTKLLMSHLASYSYARHFGISLAMFAFAQKLQWRSWVLQSVSGSMVTTKRPANEYSNLEIKLNDIFPYELGSRHGSVRAMWQKLEFFPPATRLLYISLDGLLESHHIALRIGDPENAANAILAYIWAYFCVGLPLPLRPLRPDLRFFGREARQFGMHQHQPY